MRVHLLCMEIKLSSRVKLALYQGPPGGSIRHHISHWLTRGWTWSRYSHAELVVDGMCLSSSLRNGGVRAKELKLESHRWVVIDLPHSDANQALAWFVRHEGEAYDWRGVFRFALPFIGHHPEKWFCFEAVGEMLGLAATHKLTGRDLEQWAKSQK